LSYLTYLLTNSPIYSLIHINTHTHRHGEVLDLFAPDEKSAIVNDLSSKAKRALRLLTVTSEQIWQWFVSKVRAHVHVFLSFREGSSVFRNCAQTFPSLLSSCTACYVTPQTVRGLNEIVKERVVDFAANLDRAEKKRREEEDQSITPGSEQDTSHLRFDMSHKSLVTRSLPSICRFLSFAHETTLQFVNLFNQTFHNRARALYKSRTRHHIALQRLHQTKVDLEDLHLSLDQLKIIANKTKQNEEELTKECTEKRAVVNARRERYDVANARVAKSEVVFSKRKNQLDDALLESKPFGLRIRESLNNLSSKTDLGIFCGMKKPPKGVDQVFSALMVLLAGITYTEGLDKDGRVRDRSWSASRVLLQNVGALMEDLRNLCDRIHKECVPEINFKEIRVYVAARGRDVIDVDEIKTKHELAGHLADYIVNIVKYYDISVKTRPLRNAFEEAKADLERLEEERDREKSIYESHAADLEKCVLELEKAKKEAHDAAETHRKAKIRMELSERLVAVLMGERKGWEASMSQLESSISTLLGDVLLSCAVLTYASRFSLCVRVDCFFVNQKSFCSLSLSLSLSLSPGTNESFMELIKLL